jgi:hypothetical protein
MTAEQLISQLDRIVKSFKEGVERTKKKPPLGVRVIWREGENLPWRVTAGIVTDIGHNIDGEVMTTAVQVSYVNGDDAPFEATIPNPQCEFGAIELYHLDEMQGNQRFVSMYSESRNTAVPNTASPQFVSSLEPPAPPQATVRNAETVAHPRIRMNNLSLADARSFQHYVENEKFDEMERRIRELLPPLPHGSVTQMQVETLMTWIQYVMGDSKDDEEDFYRVVEMNLQTIRVTASGEQHGMAAVRKALQEGVSKGDEVGALLAKIDKPGKGKYSKKSFSKCFKCGQNTYSKISKKCSKCGSGNDQGGAATKAGKQ